MPPLLRILLRHGFSRPLFHAFGLGALLSCLCLPLRAQLPLYGDIGIHDPSTLTKQNGRYYTFGTGDGIRILSSPDLRNWTASRVFTTPPAWTAAAVTGFAGDFWAPDVAYFNGRYHVYYSCSNWGTIDSAIGLVTTPSLEAPVWTDHGKVVQSDAANQAGPNTDFTEYNCIDPSVLVDTDGSVWLTFGSYSNGILVVQIDPATGKRLNTQRTRIANNGPSFFTNTSEAAYIYKHNGYYYLFLNFGGCCAGLDSSYQIRVGRSTSITGPYRDRDGVDMNAGGGTLLFESTGRWIGPGHAGVIQENGRFLLSHHFYSGDANGWPALGLQELEWTADGWPTVTVDWSAFYPFETDAREHMGRYNGTLVNGASVATEPGRGKVLSLDGLSQHVTLPLSVANSRTFSAWVKWNGGAPWQRIFDFGNDTTRYLFLTPSSASGVMRLGIRNGGAEEGLSAPVALPIGVWCHVAATLGEDQTVLYLNGAPVANGPALGISPWELYPRNNYLGKSQFASDPHFNGRLDAVRIFGRALSGSEIADLVHAPASLAHRYSFAADARDSIGKAHGSLLGSASLLNGALRLPGVSGAYANLPGGLVSGSSAVTIEAWATFGANAAWARLFDFGHIVNNVAADYLFATPQSATGVAQLSLVTGAGQLSLNAPGSLNNQAAHLVWTLDPASGQAASYVNGVLQTQSTGTVPSLSSVSSSWSFLGRSLFAADPWLNGSIDEFRIHDGRLTAQEIAASSAAGPQLLVHAPRTWTGSANRTWDAATTNWSNGSASSAWTDDSTALFGAGGAGAIQLATPVRPRALAFNAAGYTITADPGATLTLGPVLPNISTTAEATIQAPLVGSGGLGKTGAARLTLRAANTYTGDTLVEGGTLSVLGTGALYTGAYNNTAIVRVTQGATLELDRWGWGLANGEKAGLGGLDYAPAHLVLDGGRIRYSGGAAGNTDIFGPGFTIGAGGAIFESTKAGDVWALRFDSRGIGTIANPAGGTLTLAGVGDGILDKILPGDGALFKSGLGTWTLARATTHTGGTVVSAGTLVVNSGLPSGGTLSVGIAGTLKGSGSIATTAFISGIHGPGDGVGTQSFGGTLSYQASARLTWELAANDTAPGTFDRVTAAGAVTIVPGAKLDLVLAPAGGSVALNDAFWTQPRAWTFLTVSSVSGDFTLGSLGNDSAGRSPATYGTFSLQKTATSATLVFTPHPPSEVWRRVHFGANWNNLAVSGDAIDSDGDGVANLLERAFGSDPTLAEAGLHPLPDSSAPLLSFVYRKANAATDLVFTVEESADLSASNWAPATGTETVLSDDGTLQRIRFTRPLATDRALFLRLRVGASAPE